MLFFAGQSFLNFWNHSTRTTATVVGLPPAAYFRASATVPQTAAKQSDTEEADVMKKVFTTRALLCPILCPCFA